MGPLVALVIAVGLPFDVSAPPPVAGASLVLEAGRPGPEGVTIVHRHTGAAPQAYVVAWKGSRCNGPVDEIDGEGRAPRRCAGSTPEVRTLAPGETWTTTVRLPHHKSEGIYRHTVRYRVTPADVRGLSNVFVGEATVEVHISIRN
jgi:hypothetical protein